MRANKFFIPFLLIVNLPICILLIESVRFLAIPLTFVENVMNKRCVFLERYYSFSLQASAFRDRYLSDFLRDDKFRQYGKDMLFYNRVPGFILKQRYEQFPRLDRTVDETGYLNSNRGDYKLKNIDIFAVGDSVIQGAGVPSVFEFFKKRSAPVWILAAGSYSPRQKVQAIIEFALPKNPRLIILDFYSGNDASEAIEDHVCERYGFNYLVRFNKSALKYLLLKTRPYQEFLKKPKSVWLERNSITYNILHDIFYRESRPAYCEQHMNKISSINDIAIVKPAYDHFNIVSSRRMDWAKEGMEITLFEYGRLLKAAAQVSNKPKIIIIYNPSSYEVYRDRLPPALIDKTSDNISDFQRGQLKLFCEKNKNGVSFFDITEDLRRHASGNLCIFGRTDGIHWSPSGTKEVYQILSRIFLTN